MLLYEEAQTKPLLYRGVIPTCTVTKKLKRSLVESPLFIVMTFVECFWVPYLLIEYALQDIFMIYLCYMHTVYLSFMNSW